MSYIFGGDLLSKWRTFPHQNTHLWDHKLGSKAASVMSFKSAGHPSPLFDKSIAETKELSLYILRRDSSLDF